MGEWRAACPWCAASIEVADLQFFAVASFRYSCGHRLTAHAIPCLVCRRVFPHNVALLCWSCGGKLLLGESPQIVCPPPRGPEWFSPSRRPSVGPMPGRPKAKRKRAAEVVSAEPNNRGDSEPPWWWDQGQRPKPKMLSLEELDRIEGVGADWRVIHDWGMGAWRSGPSGALCCSLARWRD